VSDETELTSVLNQYDDLFPKTSDPDLQDLFLKIKIYLARCDGLIEDKKMLFPKTKDMRPFDPMLVPKDKSLYEAIICRLRMIKKYGITNKQQILNLLSLFEFSEKIRGSERKILETLLIHPDKKLKDIASMLGVCPATITYNLKKLKKKLGVRFCAFRNYARFKLKYYVIFMEFDAVFEKMLSKVFNSSFLTSINIDTFSTGSKKWGWLGFLIPDQIRLKDEFRRNIIALKDDVLDDVKIYEIKAVGQSWNLQRYDGREWFFPEDMWVYGLINFVEKYEDVLPMPDLHFLEGRVMDFDRPDFLIFLYRGVEYRAPYQELTNFLRNYGFSLSLNAVRKRVLRLERHNVWKPYTYVEGLGLDDIIALNVVCDKHMREVLLKAANEFPSCFIIVHEKGVMLYIRLPHGYGEKFAFLFDSLREYVDDLLIIRRYKNIGSWVPWQMYKFWDKRRKLWQVDKELLDFVSRFREL